MRVPDIIKEYTKPNLVDLFPCHIGYSLGHVGSDRQIHFSGLCLE